MIPIYAEYHYPVQNATEYHYYVHGDSTNYSPANITVYQGAPPSFVKDVSIPSSDKAYEFGTLPHSHLLNDKQFDIATMTVFHRFAYKIWNTFDAELFSNLEISFKPAQKLTMHSCSVLRNGSLINKLDMKELRVIQREEELDQLIYEEDMSAILFLEDIRIGDLLEYSYSISNIFSFDWPFAYHLPLQFSHRWEKSYYRIIKEPNHTYRIRHLPEKWSSYLTENDRELVWQIEPALPYVFEYDQPPGYCPYASAEISELGNWNELVRQEIDFYRIDPAFANDPEVIDLISNWKMNGASAQEKACLALRFVQDEIRYMGLEDGLKGMTPSDPLVTLKRRFGDCKGKTQLFRAFLLALDIPSKPVQVDTEDQKEIKNHLPIPIFNHVIARVDLPDQSIYVDPTQINQGGELKDSYLPYGFGLVISPETQDLTPIPEPLVHPEIEGSTTLMIHDDEVEMSLKTQFYGKKANKWRNRIQFNKYSLNIS